MPIGKDDGGYIVGPYRARLYRCIRDGVTDYEFYAEKAYLHTARTKANIRRDHVVARIREGFYGEPNTVLIEKNDGLFLLVIYSPAINQSLAIRFKKLDNALRASNIPTTQAEMFDEQLPLPEIPPQATYVNAGYTLNGLGTDIAGVYITCPNGSDDFFWVISIDDEEGPQPVDTLPIPPVVEIPPVPRVRVKGKSDLDREKGNESGS